MLEPDFSESQLQQVVNIAFIQRLGERHVKLPFPYVPSLIEEYDLGWDTGFIFDFLPLHGDPNQKGCNFFLQYKLSFQFTSPGAKEWSSWNEAFFRFKIPHSTKKNPSDYHQWDRLKALAKKGYPTFYVTNQILECAALQQSYQNGKLLEETPVLDVRNVKGKHKHITFTKQSNHFFLHSEIEEQKKSSLKQALFSATETQTKSLGELNSELIQSFKEMGADDESWMKDLEKIQKISHSETLHSFPREFIPFIKRKFLRSFVRRHLGADLLFVPRDHQI